MASTWPEHELREDGEVFVFVGFVDFEEKKMETISIYGKKMPSSKLQRRFENLLIDDLALKIWETDVERM
ncbi:LOW QUALITY PROTEIN: hypothetical protein NC653_034959 [Populus alba x Populus x berolinensis]|uniref:Uncharacterized protein n=1 Tax=Populus alba x Populus x berolinensis TaxID=444605 RepID=A0AAD6PYF0_9ROSI|nr:LOW QUALITY PROTEIN: hypothetical protein NC653_034959 [Populus alba x Populus x berolinensis]